MPCCEIWPAASADFLFLALTLIYPTIRRRCPRHAAAAAAAALFVSSFCDRFYSAHFQIFQADKFVSFALSLHTHARGTQRALPCAHSLSQATLSSFVCMSMWNNISHAHSQHARPRSRAPTLLVAVRSFVRPLGRSHTDTFGLL